MATRLIGGFVLLLTLCSVNMASAADADPAKAAKEQARRLQEQKRALEAEKNQLLQEKTDIAKKLELAEGEAGKKKAIEGSLRETQAQLRINAGATSKLKADVAELKNQLGAKEAEIAKLTGLLEAEKQSRASTEKELGNCTGKNDAMYRQGRELLQSFGPDGQCDAVRGEPLFAVGRVARENLLEAARDSLDEQRYRDTSRKN